MQQTKRKNIVAFGVTIVGLFALIVYACNVGSLSVSVMQLVRGLFVEYDSTVHTIYDLRFPRIFVAMFAGAALSVSGVLFQAVLKNPLADPAMIGVSSGASFATAIVISFFPALYAGVPIFACIGGFLSFFLVYSLAYQEGLRPIRIILVGIAISSMLTGFLDAFQTMNSSVSGGSIANIAMKTWEDVRLLAIHSSIGLALALVASRSCNLLALNDKTARSLGIPVTAVRLCVSFIAVLLASVATAVVGMISFVGLVVPHIARLLVGSNHKVLVPYTAILGAFLLLLADTVGRTICMPYEISASIVMAVIGGPFFIVLLRRNRNL